MATFSDTPTDPDQLARCPIPLAPGGPRCLSLVLLRDADEHERWHEELLNLLSWELPEHTGVIVAPWPPAAEHAEPEPVDGSHL